MLDHRAPIRLSYLIDDGKMVGFNMDHCKGCGICDDVCPDKVKAIKMEEEHS